MPGPTQVVIERVKELLSGAQGLGYSIARLQAGESGETGFETEQMGTLHAPPELVEKAGRGSTPSYQVYVEKIRNRMTEKFRRFSGTIHVVTEVRLSQDRIEGLTERLQFHADAVADVLERCRGVLGEGIFLTGKYETSFEPVKGGGLHFRQTARVSCEVDVNRG